VLSWRWCLHVNLLIAIPIGILALRLLVNHRAPEREPIDVPGLLTGSLGQFALVFGFSNAETHSWTAPATIIALAASPVLLVSFVAIERRSRHPLLPLHIVRDRARGGAYLSILLAAAGIFGVFFFLTFFMQLNLHFSPITSGLAFLPLTGSCSPPRSGPASAASGRRWHVDSRNAHHLEPADRAPATDPTPVGAGRPGG
jgi:hypothetical protein